MAWKSSQASVLLIIFYDRGSKESPEKSVQQPPPTPEGLSSEEALDQPEVRLRTCGLTAPDCRVLAMCPWPVDWRFTVFL